MSTMPMPVKSPIHGSLSRRHPGQREKRVLAVVRWPLGGIRTHILYTYPRLVEEGYRFTFVGPDNDSLQSFADSLTHLPGSEYIGVPTRGLKCSLYGTVRSLVRDPRFGLLHSHGMTAATHAVLGNLGRGLPHLMTVHGVFFPDEFAGFRGWVKQRMLAWIVRRIQTVVGVSNDVCQHLREQLPGLARSKVRLMAIPNSIDISRYHDLQPRPLSILRERLELSRDTLVLGFLGRYMEEKGFTILLQALQQLKRESLPRPIHLVAVGSGDKRKRYEREIVERGLDRLVTMLDYTPEVLALLRQFDLLVVPSLQEASSLVSMEAMAVGVPVLGSDCIGLREVLQGTPSRMFRSADPGALARELTLALGNLWTEEAVDFAHQARQRFDSRCSAQRFLDVYNELFRVGVR